MTLDLLHSPKFFFFSFSKMYKLKYKRFKDTTMLCFPLKKKQMMMRSICVTSGEAQIGSHVTEKSWGKKSTNVSDSVLLLFTNEEEFMEKLSVIQLPPDHNGRCLPKLL